MELLRATIFTFLLVCLSSQTGYVAPFTIKSLCHAALLFFCVCISKIKPLTVGVRGVRGWCAGVRSLCLSLGFLSLVPLSLRCQLSLQTGKLGGHYIPVERTRRTWGSRHPSHTCAANPASFHFSTLCVLVSLNWPPPDSNGCQLNSEGLY